MIFGDYNKTFSINWLDLDSLLRNMIVVTIVLAIFVILFLLMRKFGFPNVGNIFRKRNRRLNKQESYYEITESPDYSDLDDLIDKIKNNANEIEHITEQFNAKKGLLYIKVPDNYKEDIKKEFENKVYENVTIIIK